VHAVENSGLSAPVEAREADLKKINAILDRIREEKAKHMKLLVDGDVDKTDVLLAWIEQVVSRVIEWLEDEGVKVEALEDGDDIDLSSYVMSSGVGFKWLKTRVPCGKIGEAYLWLVIVEGYTITTPWTASVIDLYVV
jgi:hypothetical protein